MAVMRRALPERVMPELNQADVPVCLVWALASLKADTFLVDTLRMDLTTDTATGTVPDTAHQLVMECIRALVTTTATEDTTGSVSVAEINRATTTVKVVKVHGAEDLTMQMTPKKRRRAIRLHKDALFPTTTRLTRVCWGSLVSNARFVM